MRWVQTPISICGSSPLPPHCLDTSYSWFSLSPMLLVSSQQPQKAISPWSSPELSAAHLHPCMVQTPLKAMKVMYTSGQGRDLCRSHCSHSLPAFIDCPAWAHHTISLFVPSLAYPFTLALFSSSFLSFAFQSLPRQVGPALKPRLQQTYIKKFFPQKTRVSSEDSTESPFAIPVTTHVSG